MLFLTVHGIPNGIIRMRLFALLACLLALTAGANAGPWRRYASMETEKSAFREQERKALFCLCGCLGNSVLLMRGRMLIVFEGIDGSGKGTQAQLLVAKLARQGISAQLFSFPFYDETFFGREVGKYLNGAYGSLDTVPVEFAAMLYAGDRFEKKAALLDALKDGGTVVCDRYVPSNLAHQAAKLPREQQAALINWISNLEYNIYALPKPDVIFYLDMPVSHSTSLVLKKKKRSYTDEKLDLHEAATGYLQNVAYTFKKLADDEGWNVINCVENDAVRSTESISDEIFTIAMSK